MIFINYNAHRIGGFCTGIAFSILTAPIEKPIAYIATVTLASVVGSLLPDADEPNSIVGKKLGFISRLIKWSCGHRGLFHTLIFIGVFPLIYYWVKDLPEIQPFSLYIERGVIGLMLGYLSHLLMDMLTVSGVPLLWPIYSRKISIAKLKTNRDEWIAILFFLFIVFMAFEYKYNFPIRISWHGINT